MNPASYAGQRVFVDVNSTTLAEYLSDGSNWIPQGSYSVMQALQVLLPGFISPIAGLFPARTVSDATITNGSPIVGSATAAFTSADIGKIVTVTDPTNFASVVSGKILSVNPNGLACTLNVNASATIAAGGQAAIGFDNYAVINAALNAAASAKQVQVAMPAGAYIVSQGLAVPDGILMIGSGWSGAIVGATSQYGTTILPGSLTGGTYGVFPTTSLLQLGSTTAKVGVLKAQLENICVDSYNFTQYAVWSKGTAAEIHRCTIRRGRIAALYESSAIGRVVKCDINMQLTGFGVYLNAAGDILFDGNYIHGAAGTPGTPTANMYIIGSGDVQLIGNHFWQENPLSASLPASNMLITAVGPASVLGITATGNIFDTVYGHNITMSATVNVVPGNMVGVTFTNNWFVNNDTNFPDNTFDVFNVTCAATCNIVSFIVNGNIGQNLVAASTVSWKNLYNPTGAGTIGGVILTNNVFMQCNNVVPAGTKVDVSCANNAVQNSSLATKLSTNRGRSTQTGNGATTSFTIAHGLSDTPQSWTITPRVALAAPSFVVTADATNLTVTYATAPPATANNVDLQWQASQ